MHLLAGSLLGDPTSLCPSEPQCPQLSEAAWGPWSHKEADVLPGSQQGVWLCSSFSTSWREMPPGPLCRLLPAQWETSTGEDVEKRDPEPCW